MTTPSTEPRHTWALAVLALFLAEGCSQYINQETPGPIQSFVEPEFGRDYLLYKPSAYNREQVWPLIVVCHTSFPDSPDKRISTWSRLAEDHGF